MAVTDCLTSVAQSPALSHVEFFGHVCDPHQHDPVAVPPVAAEGDPPQRGNTECSFLARTRLFSGKGSQRVTRRTGSFRACLSVTSKKLLVTLQFETEFTSWPRHFYRPRFPHRSPTTNYNPFPPSPSSSPSTIILQGTALPPPKSTHLSWRTRFSSLGKKDPTSESIAADVFLGCLLIDIHRFGNDNTLTRFVIQRH